MAGSAPERHVDGRAEAAGGDAAVAAVHRLHRLGRAEEPSQRARGRRPRDRPASIAHVPEQLDRRAEARRGAHEARRGRSPACTRWLIAGATPSPAAAAASAAVWLGNTRIRDRPAPAAGRSSVADLGRAGPGRPGRRASRRRAQVAAVDAARAGQAMRRRGDDDEPVAEHRLGSTARRRCSPRQLRDRSRRRPAAPAAARPSRSSRRRRRSTRSGRPGP